jgi:hypothetical protein
MSASPVDPESIPHAIKDGVLASVIGGMAMVARLLLSDEKHSWAWVARRVAAASLTAVIVDAAAQGYISSPGLRIGAVGAVAYCAPEALDALLRWVKARAEREVDKVSKPAKAKPNAKAKRPAKRK